MATPSCLTGLLGLSAAGSDCFPLPAITVPGPDNTYITDSTSGLYVDRVEGLNLKPAQGHSPGGNVYARLDNARSQAIEQIETELSQKLAGQFSNPAVQLVGTFGDLGDGSYLPEGQQPLLTLPTRKVPGRGYQLHSLALYASAAVSEVPVLLDGKPVASVTTNSGPITLSDVVVPLDGEIHMLSAVLPEGVRARNNRLTCGCGDAHPNVKLALAGLRSETDLNSRYNGRVWAGGFIVNLQTTCTASSPLCHALAQDAELAKSVAFALQYRTAELLVTGFMADAAYSRYTSLEPKAMQPLLELYHNKAEEHLLWLAGATGIVRVSNPCFSCAQTGPQIRKVVG